MNVDESRPLSQEVKLSIVRALSSPPKDPEEF